MFSNIMVESLITGQESVSFPQEERFGWYGGRTVPIYYSKLGEEVRVRSFREKPLNPSATKFALEQLSFS